MSTSKDVEEVKLELQYGAVTQEYLGTNLDDVPRSVDAVFIETMKEYGAGAPPSFDTGYTDQGPTTQQSFHPAPSDQYEPRYTNPAQLPPSQYYSQQPQNSQQYQPGYECDECAKHGKLLQ